MLEFYEADESRWPDLVSLMEARGGPAYCWCLLNREPAKARNGLSRAAKRELMHQRVEAGTPVGILAYEDGEPVGWCSIAPRETFLDLGGSDLDNPVDDRAVWSLTCFFVPRARRGQGLGEALLDAAVATARSRGAQVVEAYPVDPDSPSYRHMGFLPMFERAGFREVGRVGIRRHVVRVDLG